GAEAPEESPVKWTLSVISVASVSAGIAAGVAIWGGTAELSKRAGAFSPFLYRLFLNRFYIDEGYHLAIDKVVLAAGNAVAVFDRAVVNDSGVNGTGEVTGYAGWLA